MDSPQNFTTLNARIKNEDVLEIIKCTHPFIAEELDIGLLMSLELQKKERKYCRTNMI